ncbi:hypothetical protein [Caulobacter sp. X]|uniref:hypothetical protein n=1 Tax=Caulobacter sp. X TaxID=2048901 RepID=UPI00117801D7|nr:hypothetical protein [Caulobacter sp. X]
MSKMISPEMFITIASALSSAAAMMAVLVAILNSRRDRVNSSRYDEERKVAELSLLRASYEDRISDLTQRLTSTQQRWSEMNHLVLDAQRSQPANFANSYSGGVIQSKAFLDSIGIEVDEIEVDPKFVFILTPFSPRESAFYEEAVRAAHDLGLDASRGDREFIEGAILPHIVRQILRARLVIANISGRNPNVFYELGIAQALGKATIVVSKGRNRVVPFDLRSRRLVFFESEEEDLRANLQKELARWVLDQ